MASVEAPFIIAVIREKEKSLVSREQITRMMHETSTHQVREVLLSTPYGIFLSGNASIQEGVRKALEAEFMWLTDHLDDARTLAFIGTRYDVLHLAQAVIARASGQSHVPELSSIGTLSRNTLQEIVFGKASPAKEIAFWCSAYDVQRNAIEQGTWSLPFLLDSMQRVLEERLMMLAATPFTKNLAVYIKEKHENDMAFQKDIAHATVHAYEWGWDAKVLEMASSFQYEPIGYDPIIAYWITKEMEAKTITLLAAAVEGGFSQEEISSFVRPFARV